MSESDVTLILRRLDGMEATQQATREEMRLLADDVRSLLETRAQQAGALRLAKWLMGLGVALAGSILGLLLEGKR